MQRVRNILNHFSRHKVAKRTMSSLSTEKNGVRIEQINNNYLVTLCRPKALNALNMPMLEVLLPFYKNLATQNTPTVVVMKGEGGKAFCAGGDVRRLYDMKQEGASPHDICEFFRVEYELNQILGTLPQSVANICLLNGITMGGGVGLSVHGKYRIATENTMFAMPETALGFFPDVGGSHFLPRLPNPGTGMWLALSGARLKGNEVFHAGVGTNYVNIELLENLEKELLHLEDPQSVPELLSKFHAESNVGTSKLPFNEIKTHFCHAEVENMVASLKSSEWGQKQLTLIEKMSPLALKITNRQMQEGAKLSFRGCFQMELDMAAESMAGKEFYEGVRSVLVDKDRNPSWNPKTLAEVSSESVAAYFPNVSNYN